MKIVVLASLGYSLLNFRAALLGEMAAAGHEVVACAPDVDDDIRDGLAAIGVRYVALPMRRTGLDPFADLLTLLRLVRLLRAERPDALLAYTQKPIVYGGLAARVARTPKFFAMVTGLGYAFTEGGGRGRAALRGLLSALLRAGLRRAAAVIVYNADDRATLARIGALPAGCPVLQVLGSGVDLERFSPAPLLDGPPSFLLIARLLRDKGLAEFVAAARIVRATCPAARFQLLGPVDPNPAGVGKRELDDWVAEGAVEYLGETRDVRPYLARATVFVLPSYREGLPRTVLEAMAMGRAVITTDAPGCRETVTHGRSGFLVPARDGAALAEAMMHFVRDPELADRMGRRAREEAARFDVRRVNAALLAALDLDGARLPTAAPISAARRASGKHRMRRFIDILFAAVAGTALLPGVAALALAVLATSGRPVWFRQLRSGRDGKPFRLIKFRTMTDARDAAGRLLSDELRLTRFGRIMRRMRLDELPQLWNVLKGDMSLIGPRPLLPQTVAAMGEPGRRRGAVRPGLTGWSQVNGNTLLSDAEKLRLDLWYLDNRSAWLDLRIIVMTVRVIAFGERLTSGRSSKGGRACAPS